MAFLLSVFLLAAGALSCTEAQEAYSKLPDPYRKGVDLALHHVNNHSAVQHHFFFFKSLVMSDINAGFNVNFYYHNFYLKATKCNKGTVDPDLKKCVFRNDRPLIDCAICYKTFEGEIDPEPKPYVHCVHKPSLTEEMKKARVDHCNTLSYNNGSPTLLAAVQRC
ncbi:hypothetical protein AALO_G00212910 [Alosa alosa]|uniref:Retinoic acid receptor responder protein 2 n=1 Tax=Alosa alosa TaxID=278164 RepID=A0AAV6G4P7_9TELE|nr:hypothetical protein AALO_G00212910 [Alosa alosa]